MIDLANGASGVDDLDRIPVLELSALRAGYGGQGVT